jgi:hypothetical protein
MKFDITIVIDNETQHHKTFYPNDLDESKQILVDYLVTLLKPINIDFPANVMDFEYIWFNQIYVQSNFFTYKIDDNYSDIWEYQEIYDDVLEKLLENEYQNLPNLLDLYHEEDEQESSYINEASEEYYNNALDKIDNIEEKEVEDCNCNKCIEGRA